MAAQYKVALDISCDNHHCQSENYMDCTFWGTSKKNCKDRAVDFGWVFLKGSKTVCGDCVYAMMHEEGKIQIDR